MQKTSCIRIAGSAVLTCVATACTSFSTVRSAQVSRASSFTMQASAASSPGELAGWFWSFDCVQNCGHPVGGLDLAYASGRDTESARPYSLGGGVNGLYPYVEAYIQLDTTHTRPFGIGARLGFPVSGWSEHQLYVRRDFHVRDNMRLLWNPGLVIHFGNSPNGQNPGTFLGIAQGFGAELGTKQTVFTPSVALVYGRTSRSGGFDFQNGTESKVFATAAMSMTFRPRKR